jgi:hypothetical protein
MPESPKPPTGGSGGSLDPNEHWGQGTDASHPVSAIDAVDADTPTAATTDTADALRETGDQDRHANEDARREDALPD